MMGDDNRDPSPGSHIDAYAISSDGSILGVDVASEALADSRNITANLFLAEGLPEPTLSTELQRLVPGLPDDFLEGLPDDLLGAHLCNNLAQINSAIDENQVVLAKWSRAAVQKKEVWLREKRLRTSGNHFDVDDVDPVTSQLDHERYDHFTQPYRSYDPIYEFKEPHADGNPTRTMTATSNGPFEGQPAERTEGGAEEERASGAATPAKPGTGTKAEINRVMHAAHECISFYHSVSDDKLICVLMFDPPRQHLISKVRYDFWNSGNAKEELERDAAFQDDDNSYLKRFIGILKATKMTPDHNGIIETITDVMVRIVVEDQTKFLTSISKALDDIELSIEKGLRIPQNWRDFPPRWRNHLFHQSETIASLISLPLSTAAASSSQSRTSTRDRALERSEKRLKATMRRLEGTYQVLMSTMSILESERAIEQAEAVTRLTNLAFFFIPPTFVSGVFGMNIVEFDQKLAVGMWVAVSAGVTALTYFIRFRRPLVAAAYQTPKTIRRLGWDMLDVRTRRWAQVLRSQLPALAIVALYAALGVAFWLAATVPRTDDAKIGISVSLLAVPPLPRAHRSGVLSKLRRDLRLAQHAVVAAFLLAPAWPSGLWPQVRCPSTPRSGWR
ncbi:hypothetical protein MAPG_10819 [Magnaporthiopsis poae ATCC 64411]|uniref:Uncharacterized protein n=1 Tax=Magnaporthiopsis poae (strain ATCC 64411 / 73-15) TaxID=644358 RepID=A0A0C4EDL5_MAGP6|nr:hypothetical protein MAPG_10819 [Magnaporthiopsis poae ATCC 64411]